MPKKQREIKVIFLAICLLFLVFLAAPLFLLIGGSFRTGDGFGLDNYYDIIVNKNFLDALKNSFAVSAVSAVITTVLAFFLAYTVHSTNLHSKLKKAICGATVFPMLLPTITYGFAIIYSFGREGLLTHLFGRQIFDIYGFKGLVFGYVIYTLPIAFMLIHNTFQYVDKKFIIVSKLMNDQPMQTFFITTLRPLLGAIGGAFVQSFFLSFTDYGIPASIGGQYEVAASVLYNQMLGAVPNFQNGAAAAFIMLLPSAISILLLTWLEKYNIRYQKISTIKYEKNKKRDWFFGAVSFTILGIILSVFAVIIFIPFIENWPYKMNFTLNNITGIFKDSQLSKVFINSLWVALLTALTGTAAAFFAALASARSNLNKTLKKIIESFVLVTNTIPGMVLGIAYLLAFSGTSIQNTFFILIVCNMIHFFSTPYLMLKNSLEKMNNSWETTAMLMGDNWIKTVIRIIIPNMRNTILESFSYYFVNGMVTVSAIIFLVGARTSVITTKIKQLQHYAKFDQIFALSLLILIMNLIVKAVLKYFTVASGEKNRINESVKKLGTICIPSFIRNR